MPITELPSRAEYTANAAQTIFDYPFKIFTVTDLNVYVTTVGQVANDSTDITTAYSVTGLGDEDGGTVILTVGANLGDLVTIVSNIPSSRTTDYQNNGDFRPETVNNDFDRVVSIVKKIEDASNRALLTEQSQQGPKPLSLPNPVAGLPMRWKGDLTGLENFAFVSSALVASGELVIYPNVAAMVADVSGVLVAGINAQTQGYYAAGDGGGATYLIAGSQSVDGFGDHALSNGNVALLQVVGRRNIKQYGAKGDGVNTGGAWAGTDDYAAFVAAIASIQGVADRAIEIFLPRGNYILESALDLGTAIGIKFTGVGVYGTYLIGKHTGVAVIDYTGKQYCTLTDCTVTTDINTYPKTNLLFSRPQGPIVQAGYHTISRVHFSGYVSEAALYCIASEENDFSNIVLLTFSEKYGIYMSGSDDLAVNGSQASTNTANTLKNITCAMRNPLSLTPLFIQLDKTAFTTFDNIYLAPNGDGNPYIEFTATQDVTTENTFISCGGEPAGGINTNGMLFSGTNGSDVTVDGIKFINGFFNLIAGNAVTVDVASKIILSNFEYHDTRTYATPTIFHVQLYYGLINSNITSYSGAISVTNVCHNNEIAADYKNIAIKNTYASAGYVPKGNKLNQVYYDGLTDADGAFGEGVNRLTVRDFPTTVGISGPIDAFYFVPVDTINTNTGATAEVRLVSPFALKGARFTVVKTDADNLKIDGQGSDAFFTTAGTSSIFLYNSTTEVNVVIELLCVVDGEWIISHKTGTWANVNV